MGRAIAAIVQEAPLAELAAEVDVGFGEPAAFRAACDVVIDFSSPAGTLAVARELRDSTTALVVGTTGHSPAELGELLALVKNRAVVHAANMSVGVNVLLATVAELASRLGEAYDVEIVEAHHRLKKDAPSGTALALARAVAEATHRDLAKDARYERHGVIGERPKREIGIQAVRGGDIVGDHTVFFVGSGERIEVTHRAHSRDTFARGAVQAAVWAARQAPGYYSMRDVLGLSSHGS
jgi:4-hydroxy-tetrahydrodipicolinate reductase